MSTVFYSWQSDLNETRDVIRAALDRAVRNLNRGVTLEEALPTTGGIGLYGYDYDRPSRKRIFNETEAAMVRMMFQWALEGISVYRIACTLNEKKIPSKTGSLWNHSSVNRILKNQAYTGATYYGRFRHRSMKRGKKEITKRPDSEAILVEGFTPQLITTGYFQAVPVASSRSVINSILARLSSITRIFAAILASPFALSSV